MKELQSVGFRLFEFGVQSRQHMMEGIDRARTPLLEAALPSGIAPMNAHMDRSKKRLHHNSKVRVHSCSIPRFGEL